MSKLCISPNVYFGGFFDYKKKIYFLASEFIYVSSKYRGEVEACLMFKFWEKKQLSIEKRMAVLEEWIDTYGKSMTGFAYTYLQDWGEAEEVVQEVFITVFEKMDTFEGRASIKTWLYQITANRCKDILRSSYKIRSIVTDNIQLFVKDNHQSTEDEFYQTEDSNQLAQLILSLPIKYREIIILYYYDELNTEEISKLLEVNNSTIRSRLQRGRLMLKEKLKGGVNCESV